MASFSLITINSYIAHIPAPLFMFILIALSLWIGSVIAITSIRFPQLLLPQWGEPSSMHNDNNSYNGQHHAYRCLTLYRCHHCQSRSNVGENIPILSYLIYKGICSRCNTSSGIRRFYIEVISALLAILAYAKFGVTISTMLATGFALTLLMLALIDMRCYLLPDSLTLALLWAGIFISTGDVFIPLEDAVKGAIIGYSSFWALAHAYEIISKKPGMGLGDAKLLAALLTWIPYQQGALLVLLASLTAIISIGLRSLLTQRKATEPIAFGPYLAAAGIVLLLFGNHYTDIIKHITLL